MAPSSSLSRSRIRFRAPAEDPEMDGDGWSDAEESDLGDDDEALESMTGKGIKRMCSELLELKKAADEDFERNVYSSYSTFIRIFEEVGTVESELMELEQLVLTQGKLVQVLASSLNAETFTYGLKDDKVEDLGESSNSVFDTHMQDTLETLDVLLLEHRLEEALAILEKETLTLKNQENLSSQFVMLCTQALQDRRTRITNKYVLMAEHPRVARPELQKLLSGLCRLGENQRANFLLLKVYRSRLQKSIHELECLKPYLHGIYIRELAKVVFSTISQAAKCFITLNGETAPYTSDLIQWAREETESFSHKFCTHVKSISQLNGALSMTVEAAINGISFCSLLKPQKIVSQSKLMELIRPCMEEVLQIHVDHFKKDVRLFTTSDNWDLDRFPISVLFRDKSSLTGFGDHVEYYLLTSSGREFVTLMQAIVDDISPLVSLQMVCSILKSLTDLFIEYICALERAIPSKETGKSPIANSARSLKQQLSLLVNSSTLVHFSQRIAGSLSKGLISLDNEPSSDYVELLAQKELDIWVLSIQEATDQLRAYFCQQFVYGVMSHGYFDSGISLDGWFIASSSQDPVPSMALQALFLQMRQLEKLAKSIFVEKDELIEVLLTEIVKTVIIWISENQGFWTKAVELSCNKQCGCLEQVRLDIHFLMEIARIGEYFSDDLMEAALDLITQVDAAFTITEPDPNRAVPDERWATDAARLVIRKLLAAEVANSELEEEPAATSEEDLSAEKSGTDTENSIRTSDDSTCLLDEIATAVDGDIARLIAIKDTDSCKEQAYDHTKNEYDDSESRTSTIQYANKEVREDATSTDDETHGVSETQEIKEMKVQGRIMKAEVKSIGNLDENDVKEGQKNVVKRNLVWGAELLEVENFREREAIEDLELEWLATTPEAESVNLALALETSFHEADSLRVMEGIRELKLEGLAPDSHVGSVSNFRASDAIAAQPAKEEPLYIAGKEDLFLEFELPEPDRLTEINTVKVLEVERLTTYLDDNDAIAAQPAAGRQQDIAISYAHGPKRKLVRVIKNLDITVTRSNDSGANNSDEAYNITYDNLVEAPRPDIENGSDTTDEFPQTAPAEQQDIAKNENHGQQRKLPQVSDQSEVSVMQSDVSCAEMSADIDNNPSESSLEIPGTDMDKISAISEGLVQVVGSKVDEAAMRQSETSGEVYKVLSTKLSELALETSEENKSNYGDESLGQNRNISGGTVQRKNGRRRRTVPLSGANGEKESCGDNSLGTNKNTSTDPAREKGGRKRRTLSSEENGGNGGKGSKALRPQWH